MLALFFCKGVNGMLLEQERAADETREFLSQWGLKGRYVASVCEINEKTFSRFLNHKIVLSSSQLARLLKYRADYEQRNAI